MKEETRFVAEDGKEFASKAECAKYERLLEQNGDVQKWIEALGIKYNLTRRQCTMASNFGRSYVRYKADGEALLAGRKVPSEDEAKDA